jgi:RNA-directed DNA polymerase
LKSRNEQTADQSGKGGGGQDCHKIVVRYADDIIVGFHEFARYAAGRRAERGQGKPETFDFLGFTHYCNTRKDGAGFQLGRKTQRKRLKAKLREIKETLRRHRHTPIDEQGRWLGAMMKGHFAYFAVPTNTYLLSAFRYHTSIIWFRSLRRRSQRHRLTWERMVRLIKRFLPSPRVLHPWPNHRFNVKYSR